MKTGEIERPAKNLIERFGRLATSTLANALDDVGFAGVMTGLRPVVPGRRCAGPAFTVREITAPFGTFASADFKVGQFLDASQAGDVIVVANNGHAVSTWGGTASCAAVVKGVAGLVVDGGVRDVEEIDEVGFAVFSRHVVPTTGRHRIKVEAINVEVSAAGVRVRPGDIVVADGTGVVCVPVELAEQVLALSERFAADDARAIAEIKAGLSFTEAMKKFTKI